MVPHFDELRARYLEGRLVVFAGSGVSHSGGLPSWKGLIQHLLADARASASGSDFLALDEADAALNHGDMIRALGVVQTTMTGAAYGRAVSRAFDDSGHPVPPMGRAIASLAPTLHAVVTTNLDRFLERAFAGDWPCFALPKLDLGQRRHYILQLHGTRTDRSSWVLSEHEYEALLHDRPELHRFVEGLFRFHSLLFVGYGLRDPDFDRLCAQVRVLSRSQAPQHFALMADRTVGQYERRRLADAGIELIVYENRDGSHSELLRLLGELSAAQPKLRPEETDLVRTPPPVEATSGALDAAPPAPPVVQPFVSPPWPRRSTMVAVSVLAATSTLVAISVLVAPSALVDVQTDVMAGQLQPQPQTSAPRVQPPDPVELDPPTPMIGTAETDVVKKTSRSPPPVVTKPRCSKTGEQQLKLSLGVRPSGVERSHRLELKLTFDAAGRVHTEGEPRDSPLWPAANKRLAEFAELRLFRSCQLAITWDP